MNTIRERVKDKLDAELRSVNRWVYLLKKEPRSEELEASGDNTPLTEDADIMQIGEENEIRAELLGNLLERAAALDQALKRIQEGSYGFCVECDELVHPQRLKAVPEAAYCHDCQEHLEGTRAVSEPQSEEWEQAEEVYSEKARNE